jgi:hypothetical protein
VELGCLVRRPALGWGATGTRTNAFQMGHPEIVLILHERRICFALNSRCFAALSMTPVYEGGFPRAFSTAFNDRRKKAVARMQAGDGAQKRSARERFDVVEHQLALIAEPL